MKRNKQGFTLVELLAAIVILGILMAFALPTIVNLMSNSKDKLYIDAAEKLIAQAEYKMHASSNEIEKPEIGNAIVMSLVYLNNSDFDNPPGNGEFLKEASFVVVKNTDTGLEYSATVVEKVKKGGYRGVKLAKDSELARKGANKYVYTPTETEIICVEVTEKTSECKSPKSMKSYINEHLGSPSSSYIDDVDYVYNYPSLAENTTSSRDKAPRVNGTISSASNKSYRSYDALLSLQLTDDNTLPENLKLSLTFKCSNGNIISLGRVPSSDISGDRYQKVFNFDTMFGLSGYNGELVTVNIVLEDGIGNRTVKEIEYEIHKNRNPIIDTNPTRTYVKKRNSDEYPLTKALLGLTVSDDVDSYKDLEVCIAAAVAGSGDSLDNCTDYKKYSDSSLFNNGNTMEFDFGTEKLGGNFLDGRTINMRIYVKDSVGATTYHNLRYTVHKNEAPKISNLKITSKPTNFTDGSNNKGGSLSTVLSFQAKDDMPIRDLNVKIMSDGVRTIEGKYATNGVYTIDYNFAGSYDGKDREVSVEVSDVYGQKATSTYKYKVYKNSKPTISSISVRSKERPCVNTTFCSDEEEGGSLNTLVTIEARDDIDTSNVLKACVSENEDYCKDSKNYQAYSGFTNKELVLTPKDSKKPYDGSEKTIYVGVMDSTGEIVTDSTKYKLYENKAPTIGDDLEITTTSLNKPEEEYYYPYELFTGEEFAALDLNKVNLSFTAHDDSEDSNLTFKICRKLNTTPEEGSDLARTADSEEVCGEDIDYSKFISDDGGSLVYDFDDDKYLGQNYDVTIKVKDSYGEEVKTTKTYKFYKDRSAIIDNFSIKSIAEEEENPDETVVPDETAAPELQNENGEGEEELPDPLPPAEYVFQSKTIKYDFYIRDPLDTINVCIGTASDYKNCMSDEHNIFSATYDKVKENKNGFVNINGEAELNWDYGDNFDTRTVYLVVKDSYGNETNSSVDYSMYKRCSQMLYDEENGLTFDYEYQYDDDSNVHPPISADTCKGKCFVPRNQEVTIYAKYKYKVSYFDKYLYPSDIYKNLCHKDSDIDVDCSYYMCFQNQDDKSKFYKAVGMKKVPISWSHVVQEEVTKMEPVYETQMVDVEVEEEIDGVLQKVIHEVEKQVQVGEKEVTVVEDVEHVHTYGYTVYIPSLNGDSVSLVATTEYVCSKLFEADQDSEDYYYSPKNGYVIIDDLPYDDEDSGSGDGTGEQEK